MSVQTIPLFLILRAVASEFDLPEGDLRRSKSGYADDAREAYVLVASELTLQSEMAIGEVIGRGIGYVRTAHAAARFRLANDSTWACRLIGLQAEVLAEVRVGAIRNRERSPDISPAKVAQRCVSPDRSALGVSMSQLRILGAAYLALHETVAEIRPDILTAAHTLAKAERTLRANRFTPTERAALKARDAALEALLSLTEPSKDRSRATA